MAFFPSFLFPRFSVGVVMIFMIGKMNKQCSKRIILMIENDFALLILYPRNSTTNSTQAHKGVGRGWEMTIRDVHFQQIESCNALPEITYQGIESDPLGCLMDSLLMQGSLPLYSTRGDSVLP